jgi:hypothetical protein
VYSFSQLQDKLAGFYVDHDAELLREGEGILAVIDRTEVKDAFGH